MVITLGQPLLNHSESTQNTYNFDRPASSRGPINDYKSADYKWRRGSESNRRVEDLQSPALPLGYRAESMG